MFNKQQMCTPCTQQLNMKDGAGMTTQRASWVIYYRAFNPSLLFFQPSVDAADPD